MIFDFHYTRTFIEEAAANYAKTAPALVDWLDEIYMALAENPRNVTVFELLQLQQLRMDSIWEQANYAQNRWYKVRAAMGKDRGTISF